MTVMINDQISSNTKAVGGVPQSLVLSFSSFTSMIFFSTLNILHLFYLLIIQIYIYFFCHKDLPTLINIVNQGFLLVDLGFVPTSLLSILINLS